MAKKGRARRDKKISAKIPVQKAFRITDSEMAAASKLSCHLIMARAYEELSVLAGNISLELSQERLPFIESCKKIASLAETGIEKIQKLVGAKLELRQHFQTQHTHGHLESLLKFLSEIHSLIIEALRKPDLSEATIKIHFQSVAITSKSLRDQIDKVCSKAKSALGKSWQEIVKTPPLTSCLNSPDPITDDFTIVSIDMSEYGRFSQMLQEVASVDALYNFNADIQDFFRLELNALNVNPDTIPTVNTGDGALMFFRNTRDAWKFSQRIQREASKHNLQKNDPLNKKSYRIGIACGEVRIRENLSSDGKIVSFSAAGIAIAHSVRIQDECPLDSVSISDSAYLKLSKADQKVQHTTAFCIGKPHEHLKILVRIWKP